jgi:hypothetical protein
MTFSTFMTPLQNGESLDLAFDDSSSSMDMTGQAFDGDAGGFGASAEFSSFDFR